MSAFVHSKIFMQMFIPSFIHNKQKLETTQMPITRWLDKQIASISIQWVTTSNKKEQTPDSCNNMEDLKSSMLSEKSQTLKTTHCLIPFI